jgi:hypothetical protein
MSIVKRILQSGCMVIAMLSLSGCNEPHVYGSVGVSSGYSSYGHYGGRYNSGPRMHGNIRVGGRIR